MSDAITSDSFTPGASQVKLFAASLANIKPSGFLRYLHLFLTSSGGVAGTGAPAYAADGPQNYLAILRIKDPNGHAIFDADSYTLYLLNLLGGFTWLGDPAKQLNASLTSVSAPQFSLYLPLELSPLGVGSLPNMDAVGPYQIEASGELSSNIWSTAPATIPALKTTISSESWSLPEPRSRVNGQTQVPAPPGLDRDPPISIVSEVTKTSFSINSGGGRQLFQLTRKGNVLRQVYFLIRDSSSVRQSWTAAVASGSYIRFSLDTVPIWDSVNPQHVLDTMVRRRPSGQAAIPTGVLLYDRADSWALAAPTAEFDGGFDSLLQTGAGSDLTLEVNFAGSGAGNVAGGTLTVITNDITAVGLSGEPYSFGYAGQLLYPVQPSVRS